MNLFSFYPVLQQIGRSNPTGFLRREAVKQRWWGRLASEFTPPCLIDNLVWHTSFVSVLKGETLCRVWEILWELGPTHVPRDTAWPLSRSPAVRWNRSQLHILPIIRDFGSTETWKLWLSHTPLHAFLLSLWVYRHMFRFHATKHWHAFITKLFVFCNN